MRTEIEFKEIVAKNITAYRKINNLTQLELAEKLNYSDKAVSKWERGESLPDLYILYTLATMFGITINDLTTPQVVVTKAPNTKVNKNIITLLSVGLTWLLAFITFAVLQMVGLSFAWMSFVYALPVSLIVLIVFSSIWHQQIMTFIGVSGLYYSIPLAVCLQLSWQYNCGFLFLIAIPLQILTVLWYMRKINN